MKYLNLLMVAVLFALPGFAQTTIIPFGSIYKFLDNGTNQGTTWRNTSFNDASWKTGTAQFGYGDGDEATVVSFGTNAKKKYLTTYFRKVVAVSNPASYSNFTLGLKRDDGAVVYLNGTEIFRSNMPTGTISYTTKASSVTPDDGNTVHNLNIASSAFINGNNTLAIEIHNFNINDADLSFDLNLVANAPAPNFPPVANAGNDQTITLPNSSVSLSGIASTDADGTITTYGWSQVSGPSAATIITPSSVTTTASGLVQGVYVFRLNVTDNNSASSTDDITITVNGSVNAAPVANAGNDHTITLPTSSVSLSGAASSDADGTITTYAWSQLSGPSIAAIATPSSVSTPVSNLIQGVYVFRLAVTDNNGAASTDDVTITVNPATVITTYNVINYGGVWKYLDNGTDQGTAWRGVAFNDAAWASGPGQLGYGDGDEATVVNYGPNASAKFITTYFRKLVNIASPSSYANFTLGLKRDDGVIVYVNGTEVLRSNMPTGTVTYSTLTSNAADDGNTIQTFSIASSYFMNGNNTIAVELHQTTLNSTDLSFDMELRANAPGVPALTRGPYLQMVNGAGVTLRWRTDQATNSKISVGTSFGTYPLTATNATVSTEHEVRLTGLTPDTKYFYSFGSSTQTIQSESANYFTTAPGPETTRKIRIAAFGDCGRNDNGFQSGTLASYQNYVGSSPAEIMLLLGDNAYNSGTDAEYTSNFFGPYSSNILKNHVVFPSPGNHDYANTTARQTDHNVPYYSTFTMPTAAECGGTPSGTKAFYSYNWGNIHFLSLDSYGFESGSTRLYDTLGPQATWVKNDLEANTSKWTIAYWHHPPYTMGSHNSDTETELINMRQKFIGIMERYGVDMIICGHSHDYERSYLLKGYTGNEASFNVATNAVSGSSAYYDGSSNSCPYNLAIGKVNHGAVYVVAGSAGANGGVQAGYPHNAMPFSVDDGGMLYFEVENNRLDAKFIRRDGVIADKFTIVKDAGKSSSYSINPGEFVTLTASWIGNYSWSNGSTSRSITVDPNETTAYSCTDGNSCLSDNFTVNVAQPITMFNIRLSSGEKEINAYPVPVKRGMTLNISGNNEPVQASIFNEKGQRILQFKVQNLTLLNTRQMPAGVYYLKCNSTTNPVTKKIIVIE